MKKLLYFSLFLLIVACKTSDVKLAELARQKFPCKNGTDTAFVYGFIRDTVIITPEAQRIVVQIPCPKSDTPTIIERIVTVSTPQYIRVKEMQTVEKRVYIEDSARIFLLQMIANSYKVELSADSLRYSKIISGKKTWLTIGWSFAALLLLLLLLLLGLIYGKFQNNK